MNGHIGLLSPVNEAAMTMLTRLGDITGITQGMSMSGRGAGAREGDWCVRAVSVGDIQDDCLLVEHAEQIQIERNLKTEKHLLRPGDLLVTARSSLFKAALVPPVIERTVADASLNVIRAGDPSLTHYLWWYMTSPPVRQAMQALMSGATVLSLPARILAEQEIPLPPLRDLDRLADLVEASERAYAAAIEAAQLRRSLFRNAQIGRLIQAAQ
ncbi:MAG: hypothetical protein ACR2PL_03455 [Dehalococcoidia bacterium]